MPKHDNDKLEGFFRKVAGRPDIPFHEEDWEKLEARLDAQGTRSSVVRKAKIKIAGAIVLAALLVFTRVYWINREVEPQPGVTETNNAGVLLKKNAEVLDAAAPLHLIPGSTSSENNDDRIVRAEIPSEKRAQAEAPDIMDQEKFNAEHSPTEPGLPTEPGHQKNHTAEQPLVNQGIDEATKTQNSIVDQINVDPMDNDKVTTEMTQTSPASEDKIKQNANVELPGAVEVDRTEADGIVKEENAVDQEKQLASPRLSVLLSYAPDFSSTSFNQYTAPGESFGLMVHYHVKKSWSFSAGIVKSSKKYTGDGEDYNPPKGYWKYYTNGIVPETVDGSCTILEIPIMLQYTVAEVGRSKFLVGAGASSYIMLDESYSYNFEQPNPGSREGWDSGSNSGFLFNMINITAGFEHQILPGLRLGIEPYLKIPIEEIGWSNLKLFSTGASLTLRYDLLKKEYSLPPTRSRGPD